MIYHAKDSERQGQLRFASICLVAKDGEVVTGRIGAITADPPPAPALIYGFESSGDAHDAAMLMIRIIDELKSLGYSRFQCSVDNERVGQILLRFFNARAVQTVTILEGEF